MGGRSLADTSGALLATCGGDTVKRDGGLGRSLRAQIHTDTRTHVNSVKSNHTNLVVVGAGEDKKISLWLKNGQSVGTVLPAGSDAGVNNISFSSGSYKFMLAKIEDCICE